MYIYLQDWGALQSMILKFQARPVHGTVLTSSQQASCMVRCASKSCGRQGQTVDPCTLSRSSAAQADVQRHPPGSMPYPHSVKDTRMSGQHHHPTHMQVNQGSEVQVRSSVGGDTGIVHPAPSKPKHRASARRTPPCRRPMDTNASGIGPEQ